MAFALFEKAGSASPVIKVPQSKSSQGKIREVASVARWKTCWFVKPHGPCGRAPVSKRPKPHEEAEMSECLQLALMPSLVQGAPPPPPKGAGKATSREPGSHLLPRYMLQAGRSTVPALPIGAPGSCAVCHRAKG